MTRIPEVLVNRLLVATNEVLNLEFEDPRFAPAVERVDAHAAVILDEPSYTGVSSTNDDILRGVRNLRDTLHAGIDGGAPGLDDDERRAVGMIAGPLRILATEPLDEATRARATPRAEALLRDLEARSPSAAAMLADLRTRNAGRVPPMQLENLPFGRNGEWHPKDHALVLDAQYVLEEPDAALVTIAHEYQHALDGFSGALAAGERLVPQFPPLIGEARAYTFAGVVARELGVTTVPNPRQQLAIDITDPTAAYQAVWDTYRRGMPALPAAAIHLPAV